MLGCWDRSLCVSIIVSDTLCQSVCLSLPLCPSLFEMGPVCNEICLSLCPISSLPPLPTALTSPAPSAIQTQTSLSSKSHAPQHPLIYMYIAFSTGTAAVRNVCSECCRSTGFGNVVLDFSPPHFERNKVNIFYTIVTVTIPHVCTPYSTVHVLLDRKNVHTAVSLFPHMYSIQYCACITRQKECAYSSIVGNGSYLPSTSSINSAWVNTSTSDGHS